MKVVQIGAGQFGQNWILTILKCFEGLELVGIVDSSQKALNQLMKLGSYDSSILFTSIEDAVETCRPDFIINVTSPAVHKEVNMKCIEYAIPVLCEKPIAATWEDAAEMLDYCMQREVPLMIAENYRYNGVMRKMHSLIAQGEIGRINSVHIDFFRHHPEFTNYHKDLEFPLLMDVSIHHLDMLRYLTGAEVINISAHAWTPVWSWYNRASEPMRYKNRYSDAELFIEMENNIRVSYRGSLAGFKDVTDWFGNWHFEGELGVLSYNGREICLEKEEGSQAIQVEDPEDTRVHVLREFIRSIQEKRYGETDIRDNIKTFEILQGAITSIKTGGCISLKKER